MYGDVVEAKLDEEKDGMVGVRRLDMGRSQKRTLLREMRKYVIVEATEPKLFYTSREKNGELASCILETDVKKVLADLHEGHGHFAVNITRSCAHGKVFWPTRTTDIGRWVSSCEPCPRVTKIQKAGELRSVLQFKPSEMIGMDFVGPITPTCKSTGHLYTL